MREKEFVRAFLVVLCVCDFLMCMYLCAFVYDVHGCTQLFRFHSIIACQLHFKSHIYTHTHITTSLSSFTLTIDSKPCVSPPTHPF